MKRLIFLNWFSIDFVVVARFFVKFAETIVTYRKYCFVMLVTVYVRFGDCCKQLSNLSPAVVLKGFKTVGLFGWFLQYPLSLYSRKYKRKRQLSSLWIESFLWIVNYCFLKPILYLSHYLIASRILTNFAGIIN